jgi:hypothetical protein
MPTEIDPMALSITILAPALFWAGYHYYRDRRRPEPVAQTLLAFASGVAAGERPTNPCDVRIPLGLPNRSGHPSQAFNQPGYC